MVPNNIAVVDTETTGIDKTSKICEAALYNEHGLSACTLVNPGVPIPPETSAVHHICDADVADALPIEDLIPFLKGNMVVKGITCLAAHNAEFDRGMLGKEFDEYAWICTYKCALWAWPEAPSHKNEALCYWLNLGDNGRRFNQGSHSALHDSKRTYLILNKLLETYSVEQLIEWTKLPKNITKLAFGKHVGKTWAEVDYGYLKWMCQQADFDPDYVYHAKAEIKRRFG